MTDAPRSEDFRNELLAQIAPAVKRGASHVEVNAGELHRAIGSYPGANHRMPICCDILRREAKDGDEIISEPKEGKGASLTIRFKLPRLAARVPQ